ncbi:MAG TPA: hypothetical protein VGQ82_04980, partial [Chthoniobacterales bacterium]|nr:hypothetical protein [Chthoniobacterales bacterium]
SGCKVVDDDADVVQSLDRHLPSIAEAVRVMSAVMSAVVPTLTDAHRRSEPGMPGKSTKSAPA